MNKQKSKHLDKNVIYLFLIAFLISASVLAYRYTKYAPCQDVVLSINAREFRQDELIKFKDNTENANSWAWDFGDDSEISTNKEALHFYKNPGEYTVKLIVNNICETTKTITIKEKLFVIDSTKLPIFKIPRTIKVGEILIVEDETNNASTWEWRFGETAEVNDTNRIAEYAYKEAGLKTISLIINGDVNHIAEKRIMVLALEEEDDDITPITGTNRNIRDNIKANPTGESDSDGNLIAVPLINESQFKNKLMLISQNKLTANTFSEYFCGNINKTVIVNGKEVSFLLFCEKIRGKRLKIKQLTIYREEGSNCIKSVGIKHSRFGIL